MTSSHIRDWLDAAALYRSSHLVVIGDGPHQLIVGRPATDIENWIEKHNDE